MDILVMLEENPDHSPVLAHVNSVPSPLATERPARDIVTLYGVPTAETLALALAAAVESHRTGEGHGNVDAIRHLGVSDRGASVRIPWQVAQDQKGYIEDRRPCANVDPYTVCRLIMETVSGF